MLRGLQIRDILIIDRLELDFRPGLNVLTGETGAGKSILLDSLGFVLGWRGRADLVRQGADQGEVTAWFELEPGHPALDVLAEAGLPVDDELVLRRINSREGRKTAWVNDRRVSGDVLRQLSALLVELHGQHDDRGLLDPRGHRAMLDAYGAHESLVDEVKASWDRLRRARAARNHTAAALEKVAADEAFLRHAVAELNDLAPEPGEEPELDRRRRLMQGAERVLDELRQADAILSGEGAEGALAQAVRWIEGAGGEVGELTEAPLAALDRAMAELGEAQATLQAALSALSFDPLELESVEERLFAIRAMARKHNVLPEALPGLAEEFAARLAAIDGGAGSLAEHDQAVAEAKAAYEVAADKLGVTRRESASRLDRAVMAELAPLKMERAIFTTEITATEAGPEGHDAVAFRVATNPGAPAGALEKIASGGELSRFLLALKVCLTLDARGLTLIFDEIDRGVGGATADAVGRRLAALADTAAQVLVVTHSPQVAAQGDYHWRVEKRVENGATLSTVSALAPEDRVDEIARMISGDRITQEARQAARALLEG